MLKIQSLLHTCSEFYKSKDKEGSDQAQEEGAGSSEATPTTAKAAGEVVSTAGGGDDATKAADKPSEKPSEGPAASSSDKSSATKKTSSKDVEMKDAEQSEPGAIGEPGSHQAVCVLGIALIAMGEDIGAEMALRTFNHLVSFVYMSMSMWGAGRNGERAKEGERKAGGKDREKKKFVHLERERGVGKAYKQQMLCFCTPLGCCLIHRKLLSLSSNHPFQTCYSAHQLYTTIYMTL